MNGRLLSRQADFVPDMSEFRVAIFGVGGLGSNAARLVASLGVSEITLVDPDDVELENVYPGWFSVRDVGEKKVVAVANRLRRDFATVAPTEIPDTVEDLPFDYLPEFDIGFALTDTIASRRRIWERVVESDHHQPRLWIDGRMGGDGFTVITFATDDKVAVNRYNKYEIQQDESDLPCGMKSTAYITQGYIPGLIGATMSKWAAQENFPYIYHAEAKRPGDIVFAPAQF